MANTFLPDLGQNRTCRNEKYTTKIGQNIIQQHGIHKDALGSKWKEVCLDKTCMKAYWRKLWATD